MRELSAVSFARQHRDTFLDELKELLRIPSISTLPEHRMDMEQAANWLTNHLSDLGIASHVIAGNGHPLVYGEWLHVPGKPTVLVYGHYDVQPADPIDLWESPPFDPTIRQGNLYARGASDDKGQTMTFLHAVESFMRTEGKLPVNLKFLIEGEEECGGQVIKHYASEHREDLQADFVQIADSGMFAPGIPTLETGLRGIVYTEIHAQGARQDLHSGLYGGVAPNPLNALAHVIAGLKDQQGRITIPGFYDDVRMPDDDILETWHDLPFDEQRFLAEEVGSTQLAGEPGFTPIERIWARPTLDVHGIVGGFVDPGAKTVIPARASAKVSMRLVSNQRANRIFELYRAHVHRLVSPGITVNVELVHGDDPVLVATDSQFVDRAREALQQTFGRPAVLGRSGGSIPIVGVFKELLGMNSILMGWGLPDDNLHAPNEKLTLDNFYQGIETNIRFWQALGQSSS